MAEITAAKPKAVSGTDPLFRALIGAAMDGVVVIGADGRIKVFSAACEALFGFSAAEVVGQKATMLVPDAYRAELDDYLSQNTQPPGQGDVGLGREIVGQRKDLSTFPMYLSVGASEPGGERFFVGIIRDLSARLESEVERRKGSDRLLAQIVRSSNDAILSKTLDGVITSWNAAAEEIFGYTASEAIGQPISILIPPNLIAEEEAILAQLRAGQNIEHFETMRRRKDGVVIPVSLSVSPVRDGTGRIFGASKTLRDVSEKKSAEARLRGLESELARVARLNSMEQMSAALAHELNQPLTAITNFIGAARRELDRPGADSVARALGSIAKAADQTLRASAIIRSLRDFVKKHEGSQRLENLDEVIEEAISLALAGDAGDGVSLELHLAPGLPRLSMDKIQIQQVLINLVRNAVEAMQPCTTRDLTITTLRETGEVCLTVEDSGPGISPELLSRLFQPYVTTKKAGMGVGLAICKSIVEAHGGRISARSEGGAGTCFSVYLPLREAGLDDACVASLDLAEAR